MNETKSTNNKIEIWRERIAAQVASKQTVQAFCNEQQINLSTFYGWRNKLSGAKPSVRARRFINITQRVETMVSPRIHLPNGVKIELGAGLESAHVSALIHSLCGVGHASGHRDSELSGVRRAKS